MPRRVRRPPRWVVIATVLGVAIAVSTAAVVADAGVRGAAEPGAAVPEGWHIVGVYRGYQGGLDQGMQLQALAAVSSTDAWVAGSYGPSLTVRQWNGKTWRLVAAPPGFTFGPSSRGVVFDSVLAASSARDMWTFPQTQINRGPLATYGLHWTGTSWTKSSFLTGVSPLSAADFGPDDAWLFGQTQKDSGRTSAFAARWNGSTWRDVPAPGRLWLLSALGPDDMWGVAGNNVAHWTGTAWRTVPLPALPALGANANWQPDGIAALRPDNVWVSEIVSTPVTSTSGGSNPPFSTALLHWNGSAWTVTAARPPGVGSGSLAYNGAGGFWLTVGEGDAMANPADLLSYTNGKWLRQLAPTRPGYVDYSVYLLTYIPGNRSLWALADFDNLRAGQTDTAILKYGP